MRGTGRFLCAALAMLAVAPAGARAATVTGHDDGSWTVALEHADMTLGGTVGQPVSNVADRRGEDALGAYREVDFEYRGRLRIPRRGAAAQRHPRL